MQTYSNLLHRIPHTHADCSSRLPIANLFRPLPPACSNFPSLLSPPKPTYSAIRISLTICSVLPPYYTRGWYTATFTDTIHSPHHVLLWLQSPALQTHGVFLFPSPPNAVFQPSSATSNMLRWCSLHTPPSARPRIPPFTMPCAVDGYPTIPTLRPK